MRITTLPRFGPTLVAIITVVSVAAPSALASQPQTSLISRAGYEGPAGDAPSGDPGLNGCCEGTGVDITPDGRYIAYVTTATNLAPRSPTDQSDIMVRDTLTGTDELVSVPDGPHTSSGPFSSGYSVMPSISDDGRYVVWADTDNNLRPNSGLSQQTRIWVRDRQGQSTQLVSQMTGVPGTDVSQPTGTTSDYSLEPDISGDGKFVSFLSTINGLGGPETQTFFQDIYRRSLVTNETVKVSRAAGMSGAEADSASGGASISADGRFVAFGSGATNLGDGSGVGQVYVRDVSAGDTIIASSTSGGTPGNAFSGRPSISADGTRIAFESTATNLGTGASGRKIFVKDRTLNAVYIASRSTAGSDANADAFSASLAADGGSVAFESAATNLLATTDPGSASDIFVRMLPPASPSTFQASVSTAGAGGDANSIHAGLANGAASVAFESLARNLAPTAVAGNVFARDELTGTPDNTAAPEITGDPTTAGNRVTCTTGTWNRKPTSFARQWLLDGGAVPGETGTTYLIRTAEFGRKLSCQVTASNAVGPNGPATSAQRLIGKPAVDADGDGYPAGTDCNDADPKINPAAKEIVGNTVDENCDGRKDQYRSYAVTTTLTWARLKSGRTKLKTLIVENAGAGATVKLSCSGKGCAKKAKKKVKTKSKTRRKLSLTKSVKGMVLRPKAKLKITITRPGYIGRVTTYTMVNHKDPKKSTRCLPPGAKKTQAC